jgi:hypothetical protein
MVSLEARNALYGDCLLLRLLPSVTWRTSSSCLPR